MKSESLIRFVDGAAVCAKANRGAHKQAATTVVTYDPREALQRDPVSCSMMTLVPNPDG